MKFTDSYHCRSRVHCFACRTNADWRTAMGAPEVCPFGISAGLGIGDAIHVLAGPVARALGLSCIDKATNELKPQSPCAKRKAELNEIRIGGNIDKRKKLT